MYYLTRITAHKLIFPPSSLNELPGKGFRTDELGSPDIDTGSKQKHIRDNVG